jgi:hypothetical protein
MNDASIWTIDALKAHFDRVFEEKDKALEAALASVAKENAKTEVAAEKRFELLNELRGDVATKAMLEALEKVVGGLKERVDDAQGVGKGRMQMWGFIIGAVVLASSATALLSKLA